MRVKLKYKAVSVLQVFYFCTSTVPCVAFVLSLFVPHLSFFRYLAKALLRNCGIFNLFTL